MFRTTEKRRGSLRCAEIASTPSRATKKIALAAWEKHSSRFARLLTRCDDLCRVAPRLAPRHHPAPRHPQRNSRSHGRTHGSGRDCMGDRLDRLSLSRAAVVLDFRKEKI